MASQLFKELTTPNGIKYQQPLGLFIDNKWVASKENDDIITINPTDESEICKVQGAGAEDIDDAVKAARNAFENGWRDTDATVRGDLLHKLARLTEEHADILASIETWDNGKTYNAARNDDLPEAIGVLKYYAGWADKLTGQLFSNNPEKLAYTVREPLGVCAGIIPWNFPLSMATYKLAPALAAGNTIILKIAEQTPLSALYFANLVKEAGFPPGVVSIVNGFGRKAGVALAEHPDINKISFTGSTPTGKEIMKTASNTMKRVTLETGGKSPMIILDDADLEQAIEWAHSGIMYNQGQVCSATSRLFVQEGIYDDFIAKYKQKVEGVKVGNPFEDDTFQGPQVTRVQFEKILGYIETGKKEGATLATGGIVNKNVNGSQGLFISPTIFTDVEENMQIFQEEVFGPFVVVCKFKNITEAIRKANNSVFGLGSAVFTKDITKAHTIARRLDAGTVWINSSNDADIRVPFGGYKQSGIGIELGEMGLLAYTTCKAVHINVSSKL
ncbi:Aldehyde dehydrogenase [Fusarium oxysporum f. sp. cubense]|uniref:aldehyde dehydrogenase (NAD(+)) n=1 Tax=Fusarium oxysporum f. sp. cubense TaxID=61366 RepID=A0A559LAQ7_FUSOC|nr:Aldehyde dehydrogenase [Fusarium oxysporum f. sp. cubense]